MENALLASTEATGDAAIHFVKNFNARCTAIECPSENQGKYTG